MCGDFLFSLTHLAQKLKNLSGHMTQTKMDNYNVLLT